MTTKQDEMQKMQPEEIKQWLAHPAYKLLVKSLAICKENLLHDLTNLVISDEEDGRLNKDRQYVKGQLAVIKSISDKDNVIEIVREADLIEESEDD